jgi:hypothetical protein
MSNKWETAEKRSKEIGSGIFVQLTDDGDAVICAILGDPEIFDMIWDAKLERTRAFTAEDKAAGKTASTRYAFNCYVPSENTVKILKVNNATFKLIAGIKNKPSIGLDKYYLEIKRNGKKKDTKVTYGVLPEREIPEADRAMFKTLKLHDLLKSEEEDDEQTDLSSHDKANSASATAAPAASPPPDVISAEQRTSIIARLKVLSPDVPRVFLAKFGVQTVGTLPASRLQEALAELTKLEGKPVEVDPLS